MLLCYGYAQLYAVVKCNVFFCKRSAKCKMYKKSITPSKLSNKEKRGHKVLVNKKMSLFQRVKEETVGLYFIKI